MTGNTNEQVHPHRESVNKGTGSKNDQSHQLSPLSHLPYSKINGTSISSDEGSRSTQAVDRISDSSNIDTTISIAEESPQTPEQAQATGYSLPFSPGALLYQGEKHHPENMFLELSSEIANEYSFIVRHFSHVIGPWLDLSDSDRFFSVHVPIRAIGNKALKYAMAAITAKHLGQTRGTRSNNQDGIIPIPTSRYSGSDTSPIDWFLEGQNYYSMADTEVNRLLSEDSHIPESSAGIPLIQRVTLWLSSDTIKSRLDMMTKSTPDVSFLRKVENVLATAVLLTTYASMDINAEDWPRHLLGICALFEAIPPYDITWNGIYSHGIRAAFWNLARQDLISAYFTRSATQLDPENLPLWCSAGISIDENRQFQMSLLRERGLTKEDQAANGILWLVSKIVNFLSRAKQAQLAQLIGLSTLELPTSQHTNPDPAMWLQLCFDLQTWFNILPETFRSSVRIDRSTGLTSLMDSKLILFPEIFYGLPACATAMQCN
ncbi:hypothetical protein PVAR5_8927 [Paecilomyces variotii No. 5]|uniref:C6 transcription factor n=1 Tax=Byssochlamys spectabilis (strain No. 5 / NBRC 109023) TaxID=1356009 RepID=V5FQ38_BYSSN|nr:hypothetical protein PVAR5_8927 [Paecilomyces variotii No. 5]